MYSIRLARPQEAELLPVIEEAAGVLFAEIGMTDVAGGQPVSVATHRAAQARGRLWVAADAEDRAVGFALVAPLDGCLYLKELSVHPDHGRRGLGRRLVEAVAVAARLEGLPAVTLSTFRDVAWNGPFYRRCSFRELGEEEITPGLLEVRRQEAAAGLDVKTRCFMRRDVSPRDL